MKRTLIVTIIVLVCVVIAAAVSWPFYIVQEGEQAVVTRFGEIVSVQRDAGLKLKTPGIDQVSIFPNKIMSWDGEPQRIPTKENQFIWVDTTARWRISDPRKFYESVGTIESAYARLDDVIDSAVRTIISSNYLREAVRNSNEIRNSTSKETFETGDATGSEALQQLTQTAATYEEIDKGRKQLSQEMIDLSRKLMPEYGIELIDILPRQIKYSDELTESVYNRMIKERNQIAQAFRSYGEGKKAEWLGKQDNEKRSILSGAYETAEKLKGKADAEATKIYADAYGRDASFFDFWRATESYKTTMPKFQKTLSTDLDYFKYLYSPKGR
jgi:modulator of FtsH protease HflC